MKKERKTHTDSGPIVKLGTILLAIAVVTFTTIYIAKTARKTNLRHLAPGWSYEDAITDWAKAHSTPEDGYRPLETTPVDTLWTEAGDEKSPDAIVLRHLMAFRGEEQQLYFVYGLPDKAIRQIKFDHEPRSARQPSALDTLLDEFVSALIEKRGELSTGDKERDLALQSELQEIAERLKNADSR